MLDAQNRAGACELTEKQFKRLLLVEHLQLTSAAYHAVTVLVLVYATLDYARAVKEDGRNTV